ncbi:unnamed protein product [Leptidea sinapis]|uniref:Aip3p/Bud6 N-terminal domain-containing protein n=1 Tax=Leptidea sinapis TaxID=189913 RepID=A0A5E4PNQ7_9NEOP|nr:unnamed protein product [Leptidea sinapis]
MLPMNKLLQIKKKGNPITNTIPESSFQSISAQNTDLKSMLAHFDDRFNSLNSTIESFKCFFTDEFRKLSETVTSWSSKITTMDSCINTIVDCINDLDKEVSKVNSYQIELNDLKQKINELPSAIRRHLKKRPVASKSGYCLNPDTDIDFVTRVAIKNDSVENKPRPIILKMQARYKKDDFLSSLRKIKNLKASDLGYAGVNTPIYANDHLSTYIYISSK